jgi:hypothetical protein
LIQICILSITYGAKRTGTIRDGFVPGPARLWVFNPAGQLLHTVTLTGTDAKRATCKIPLAQKDVSTNHFIRPRQHIRPNRETDLLGGLQIDDDWDSAAKKPIIFECCAWAGKTKTRTQRN